jgi:hypothetical protein
LGNDLDTSFPDSPYFLETPLEVKVVDHFFIEELWSDVFSHDFEFGDNLFFDSDAGFVVEFGVLIDEEFLIFLMRQVGSHFGDQLN